MFNRKLVTCIKCVAEVIEWRRNAAKLVKLKIKGKSTCGYNFTQGKWNQPDFWRKIKLSTSVKFVTFSILEWFCLDDGNRQPVVLVLLEVHLTGRRRACSTMSLFPFYSSSKLFSFATIIQNIGDFVGDRARSVSDENSATIMFLLFRVITSF